MRTLLPLAAAFAAATLSAQSPLSLPFNANNGLSAGAQVFFDLSVLDPNGITIHTIDVNTGTTTTGTVGSVEVYTTPTTFVGAEQTAASWTLAASGPVMALGNNVPSPACLGAGFFLPAGTYGVAVRHIGVALRYTGTSSTAFPPIFTGATAELTLTAGKGQATAFSSAPINFRVFNGNIHYNLGNAPGIPCVPFAGKVTYGTGCYARGTSWYENFADLTNFDFVGAPGTEQVIVATPAGAAGYVVSAGTSAWFNPVAPKVLSNAATPAAMTDDTMSGPQTLPFTFSFPGGSTSVIHICTNGFVVLGPTTATTGDFTATPAEMHSQLPRLFTLWADWMASTNVATNPASGVYFDVDPSNQIVYATWLDVADRRGGVPTAGATTINLQCAIHANGSVEYRYRNIVPRVGALAPVIAGFSKGNLGGSNSVDTGSRDLSVTMPFATQGPDQQALALDSNLPKLGQSWDLTTTNVEAISPIAITFFGDQQINPGIDLGFLGAPGCNAYTNANLASLAFGVTAGSGVLPIPVPNAPALAGATLSAQSVSFTVHNMLLLNFSNGVLGTIGM